MCKRITVFSILILLTFYIFAEEGIKVLSLDQALNLALENNISLQREKISLEAAERASAHSWNSLLPSISLAANENIEFAGAGNSDESANNFGLEGKVSLSLGPDFFSSMRKAKLEYEAKKISFDQALCQITADVKESYFSLLLASQNLDFLKENLEGAKNQVEQNEERFHRGTLSEMEYLSSKISYEKLKSDFNSQELLFKKELKSFCLIIGLDEDVKPEGKLEDFISTYAAIFDEAKKEEISKAVKNGSIPSLMHLQKQLESAQKDISIARFSAYGPSGNISYSASPVLKGSQTGQLKQSVAIEFSLPLETLLPVSKGADSIKNAKDSVNDLQLQLAEKSRSENAEFSFIIKSLSQKKESIASLKNYVNLAEKNYQATKYSYSKGITEFLSMQNASKENLEAKMNLQNEFLETLKLYISLEKLYGGTK